MQHYHHHPCSRPAREAAARRLWKGRDGRGRRGGGSRGTGVWRTADQGGIPALLRDRTSKGRPGAHIVKIFWQTEAPVTLAAYAQTYLVPVSHSANVELTYQAFERPLGNNVLSITKRGWSYRHGALLMRCSREFKHHPGSGLVKSLNLSLFQALDLTSSLQKFRN